jgi:hypothetical protein
MIRKIIWVVALAVLAAGAGEINYEYPPEYGELFGRFRAITAEEAVMMVSVMGYIIDESSAGSVILEPIAVKSTDGLPGYYWILSQKTDDAELRKAAKNVISMVNAENGFNPYVLEKECEVLKERYRDFCTFYVNAWTWYGEIGYHSSTMDAHVVNEFQYYLNLAEELSGEDDFVRARFYAANIRPSSPVVVFETREGIRRYLCGPRDNVEEIDYERVKELAAEGMKEAYTHFKEHPDAWDAAESRWVETLRRIEREARKENGYYKLQGPGLDFETDENEEGR